MAEFSLQNKSNIAAPQLIKNGELVSAKFSDNTWYRAKVRKVHPDKMYELCSIDFGTCEMINISKIRPLPTSFSLSVLPALAIEARLSFITYPSIDQEYGPEVQEYIRSVVDGKKLQGIFGTKDKSGVVSLILRDQSDGMCSTIQERMLIEGWATVDKAIQKRYESESGKASDGKSLYDFITTLLDAQNRARRSRTNLWRYGDITSDE